MNKAFIYAILILAIFGCKKEEITDLVLIASKSEIVASGIDYTVFNVNDASGKDITSKVQLFHNDMPFNNTNFTADVMGEHFFWAELEGLVSNTERIKVNAEIKHQKNILIEDYTGTWCGYCPRVASAIDEVLEQNNNIDMIGIHDDRDMLYSRVELLKNNFDVEGFPTAMINRSYKWPFPENMGGLRQGLSEPALCGLAAETTISEIFATLKVKVEFAGGYIAKSKLVVYLVENEVKFDQANFYPEYGSNPIKNFVHKNVLRLSLTEVLGDEIEFEKDDVYQKNFSLDFKNNNPADFSIVAFVVNANTKEVLNSRTVQFGETADFQPIN